MSPINKQYRYCLNRGFKPLCTKHPITYSYTYMYVHIFCLFFDASLTFIVMYWSKKNTLRRFCWLGFVCYCSSMQPSQWWMVDQWRTETETITSEMKSNDRHQQPRYHDSHLNNLTPKTTHWQEIHLNPASKHGG